MLNYLFPIFNLLENTLLKYLSFPVRVGLWGALCGGAAMLVFYLASDQKKISTLKTKSKELRKKILSLDTEDSEVKRLIKENLSVSLKLLYKVLFPALLSTLPIIVIFLWMDVYYACKVPEAGDTVTVRVASNAEDITFLPEDSFETAGPSVKMCIRDNPPPIKLMHSGKMLYQGEPWRPPTRNIIHKKYWNAVLKSEAGYLNPDISDVDLIEFGFHRNWILKDNQSWYSRWEFLFFLTLAISSLIIKLVFKIE